MAALWFSFTKLRVHSINAITLRVNVQQVQFRGSLTLRMSFDCEMLGTVSFYAETIIFSRVGECTTSSTSTQVIYFSLKWAAPLPLHLAGSG